MVDFKEIQKLMIEKDKSNKELADYMGISPQALSKKRRGLSKWTIDDAVKICDFLQIEVPEARANIFLS